MTTSHTPGLGSSFELALIALEENSISAAGVRAIKICNAADDLLAALQAMLTHMGMDEDDWNKPTFDQARAAILKATQ
jgi:hypothetical protein